MRNWRSFTAGRSLGWLMVGLVAVLAFAFAAPECYWAWVGARKREYYYQGKPTSYWSAVLRKPSPGWAAFLPTSLRGFLGLGGYPAVLRRDPAAVPVLLDLLKDEDSHVRWDALLTLTETPILPAEVPQAILPLLTQEHGGLRSFAAYGLTKICQDETLVVPALLPLLRDKDVGVRRSVVNTLAPFGAKSPAVIAALSERLHDPSEQPSVRSSAAAALGSLKQAAQSALPVLREALREPEGEIRIAAATALWQITNQATTALPIVLEALQDPDGRMREKAVYSLGTFSPDVPGVVPALVQALKDPQPTVRCPACCIVERMQWAGREEVHEVIQALTRLVREEKHPATLEAAIRALGHIGSEAASAVPLLARLLQTPNQLLRTQIADALFAMGPAAKEAVPALQAAYQRGTAPFLDRPAVIAALRRIDPDAAARNNVQ